MLDFSFFLQIPFLPKSHILLTEIKQIIWNKKVSAMFEAILYEEILFNFLY